MVMLDRSEKWRVAKFAEAAIFGGMPPYVVERGGSYNSKF